MKKEDKEMSGAVAFAVLVSNIVTVCCLVAFIIALVTDNSELCLTSVMTILFFKFFSWLFKAPR